MNTHNFNNVNNVRRNNNVSRNDLKNAYKAKANTNDFYRAECGRRLSNNPYSTSAGFNNLYGFNSSSNNNVLGVNGVNGVNGFYNDDETQRFIDNCNAIRKHKKIAIFEEVFNFEFFVKFSGVIALTVMVIEAFIFKNLYNFIVYGLGITFFISSPFLYINQSMNWKIRFVQKTLCFFACWISFISFPLIFGLCILGK